MAINQKVYLYFKKTSGKDTGHHKGHAQYGVDLQRVTLVEFPHNRIISYNRMQTVR